MLYSAMSHEDGARVI